MPIKKHHLKLDSDEREHLESLTRKQKVSAVKARRARAMLAMDCGPLGPALSDSKASRVSGLSVSSLERLRERVCEIGALGALGALERKPRLTPPVEPVVTGEVEALMVKIACSAPPGDHGGKRERSDAESVREGSISAFMIAMPYLGKREVYIGREGRRTALDYAEAIEFLCDVIFPEASRIVLVQDNLNIHACGSLSKRFPPEKACRLAGKLEPHDTPKHGSWLNMAEIEISLLARGALRKRIPSAGKFRETVCRKVERRNASPRSINWQFTTKDARIKLNRIYPQIGTG